MLLPCPTQLQDQPQPQRIRHGLDGQCVVAVACGDDCTAAVTDSGSLYMWGRLHMDSRPQLVPLHVRGDLTGQRVVQVRCMAWLAARLVLLCNFLSSRPAWLCQMHISALDWCAASVCKCCDCLLGLYPAKLRLCRSIVGHPTVCTCRCLAAPATVRLCLQTVGCSPGARALAASWGTATRAAAATLLWFRHWRGARCGPCSAVQPSAAELPV